MKSFWLAVAIFVVWFSVPLEARISPVERKEIDKALGMTGKYVSAEDTYKLTFAPIRVKLVMQGQEVAPLTGVQSRAAFIGDPHHGGCLLVADLALLENEVSPILSTALENGFAVTSLGNEYLFEQPRVLFMQVSELGEPAALAGKLQQIRKTINANRTAPRKIGYQSGKRITPTETGLDAAELDSILMAHGRIFHGVYEASMGMAGTIFGVPSGKQVGLRTWITFAGTKKHAFVEGQIIMTESQIRNVLRALRKGGIYVTALHNHFIDSNPDFFFVHFWGKGPSKDLALTVQHAMETQLR
jgi:uncharacterized protein DUF1259